MRWKLLGLGIGAYAIGLITTAPATLVDAGLQRASNGRLRLAEAQGTLWSGAGQIEIRAAGGRTGIAKSFTWLVLPASLLRGHLLYEVKLDQAARPVPVTISFSRIELAGADINLPAAVLGFAVPKLAPLRLTGDARLHIESLSVGRSGMQGNATLQWLAAGSALTPVSPLGDYELRVKDDGAVIHASLRTLQGPLQLDGKGLWAKGGKPAFLATARVAPQQQQQLAPLLRLIAIERGEGSFELQVK
jgi:general secretion pathway protein N